MIVRSATCSLLSSCRSACRCWSPATRSGARSAVTTTLIARTTRSHGSTGKMSDRRIGISRVSSAIWSTSDVTTGSSRARVFCAVRCFPRPGSKTSPGLLRRARRPPPRIGTIHIALSLGYVLSGAAGEFFTPGGQRDIDESFLVMINAYSEDLDFSIPLLAASMSWEPLVDTARPTGRGADGKLYAPGEVYRLQARSFALFINRAPRPEPARANTLATNVVLTGIPDLGEDDATPS